MKDHSVLRKGAWTSEEDNLLRKGIEKHGEGRWHLIPRASGKTNIFTSDSEKSTPEIFTPELATYTVIHTDTQ